MLTLLFLLSVAYAELLGMTWSKGDLKPDFDTDVVDYSIILPSSVESINVLGAMSNDRYYMLVDTDGYDQQFVFSGSASMDFNLTFGDNDFVITDEQTGTEHYVLITRVTYIPEPQPDATVQVCEMVYQLLVNLIADQFDNNYECATLSSRVFNLNENGAGDPISTDEMCDCYVLSPPDIVYTYDCALIITQQYSIEDMARMCNGDIGPSDEGITSLQLINQIQYGFDESTWEGNLVEEDDPEMSRWWKMRQTFNITDPSGDGVYLFAQFTTDIIGNWSDNDAVLFGVNYEESFMYYLDELDSEDCRDPCQTTVIVALDDIDSTLYPGTYTVVVESTLNGDATDESFVFSMDTLGILSDYDIAIHCANENANKENTVYPKFVHDDSRFYLSPEPETSIAEKARLKLSITVPRALYDFQIAFEGATNDLAGYDMTREYDYNTDNEVTETYWTDQGVPGNDACGEEEWVAYFPWEVFGPDGGAGGVQLLYNWTNGSQWWVDDGSYLNYGSELIFSGKEYVYQISEGGREWIEEKSLVWRMPFVVRFQRIVYVETDIFVSINPYDFKFVAAITEKIQSETVYTLNSQQHYYAKFDFEIRTRTQYPYMLVSGQADDDPPNNWLNINSPESVYPDPLTDGDWHPAQVIYSPLYSGLSVETNLTFKSEVSADCTYIDYTHITDNYPRVCEQYWNLEVVPSASSCYASGDYTITWSGRCFYDKPVCYFYPDEVTGEIHNYQTITLAIETTRICPVVVQDIDAQGVICSTGRDRYYKCADYEQQYPAINPSGPEDDPVIDTYFQGDTVYFFMEVASPEALIIYTRIYQIWATQDMSSLTGSNVLYDLSFQEVKLYDYGNPVTGHTFTAEGSSISQELNITIAETRNSNDFATYGQSGFTDYGIGPTDDGVYSGFTVRLDPLIFPVLADAQNDVTFTVILDIFYEGWGNQKTNSGWNDDINPIGRRSLKFNARSRKQETTVTESYIPPGGTEQLIPKTSIAVLPPAGTYVHCFKPERGTDAWAMELSLANDHLARWENPETREAFEAEFETQLAYVLGANEGQINLELMNHPRELDSDSNMLATLTIQDGSDTLASSLLNHMEHLTNTMLLYSQGSIFDGLYVRRTTCIDLESQNLDVDDFQDCVFGNECELLGGSTLLDYLVENGQEDQLSTSTWLLNPYDMTEESSTPSLLPLISLALLTGFLL